MNNGSWFVVRYRYGRDIRQAEVFVPIGKIVEEAFTENVLFVSPNDIITYAPLTEPWSVQQLINALALIEDKTLPVMMSGRSGASIVRGLKEAYVATEQGKIANRHDALAIEITENWLDIWIKDQREDGNSEPQRVIIIE